MSEGRGAWTLRGKRNKTTSYKWVRFRRDGAIPRGMTDTDPEYEWFVCVEYGVAAIQALLADAGYPTGTKVPGIFDRRTRNAARKYQAANNIAGDGVVGPLTMNALARGLITQAADKFSVDPQWMYGLAVQESGFDPGAQGLTTPADRGLWQFNTLVGMSVADAFNPVTAADAAAVRWRNAWQKYKGKGKDLRLSC